ncbi:MAG: hypothetical protein ACMXYD_02625 [Candidatus Woesearchaeota archaeon]
MTPPLVGLDNPRPYTLQKGIDQRELIDTPRYFTANKTIHELYANTMQQAQKFFNRSELENTLENTHTITKRTPTNNILSLYQTPAEQTVYDFKKAA